jgi:hypothetical protein
MVRGFIVRATSTAGVILLLLLLKGAACATSPLPDAAAAAKRPGEYLTFEDAVKAVSKSRTRDGYYLSFGAPYPKQVLSAWLPQEVLDQLPREVGLLGRSVRITGKVESSSTGPMLSIEGPDKVEILPIDEAVLSKPDLGGRVDRGQFSVAVRQSIDRGDFDTVEVLGRELHETRERFNNGTWMLEAFFSGFELGSDDADAKFSHRIQAISRWKSAHPSSILPILAESRFYIDDAWRQRGDGYSDTVSEEGERKFSERLAAARRILENNPQAKSSPDYFNQMLTIALGQGWSKSDYFRLFDEAVSREPDYYTHYFRAAYYLLPRWRGERGDWERFAEEQRQKRGGEEGDILYARIAWSVAAQYPRKFFEVTDVSWETMAAGLEALMKKYPDSRPIRNSYAHFAYRAGDRERLIPALEAIRGEPDMGVWVNLENVEFAERFARGETREPRSKK